MFCRVVNIRGQYTENILVLEWFYDKGDATGNCK